MTFRNEEERSDWKACYLAVVPRTLEICSERIADQYVKALRERAPKQTVIRLTSFLRLIDAVKGIREVTQLSLQDAKSLVDSILLKRVELPGSDSFTAEHTTRVRMILDGYGVTTVCEDVQN